MLGDFFIFYFRGWVTNSIFSGKIFLQIKLNYLYLDLYLLQMPIFTKLFCLQIPDLKDSEAMQRFFLQEVQLGEELLAAGRLWLSHDTNEHIYTSYTTVTGDIDNGVNHLSNAVAVCGQPQQLLQVLQQTLPAQVFQMLLQGLPQASEVSYSKNSCQIHAHLLYIIKFKNYVMNVFFMWVLKSFIFSCKGQKERLCFWSNRQVKFWLQIKKQTPSNIMQKKYFNLVRRKRRDLVG